jgi:hypothetical protein
LGAGLHGDISKAKRLERSLHCVAGDLMTALLFITKSTHCSVKMSEVA